MRLLTIFLNCRKRILRNLKYATIIFVWRICECKICVYTYIARARRVCECTHILLYGNFLTTAMFILVRYIKELKNNFY